MTKFIDKFTGVIYEPSTPEVEAQFAENTERFEKHEEQKPKRAPRKKAEAKED